MSRTPRRIDETLLDDSLRAIIDAKATKSYVDGIEASRVTAENARVAAESKRQTDFNVAITEANAQVNIAKNITQAATEAANAAEDTNILIQNAEDIRAAAEASRVTAEAGRVAAENSRKQSVTQAANTLNNELTPMKNTLQGWMNDAEHFRGAPGAVAQATPPSPNSSVIWIDTADDSPIWSDEELTAFKTDYTNQRAQDQLKVAKVEKDLNDYQKAMQGININNEPTQKVSGHGIVNLPKNTANGQFSDARVRGLAATNLVKNGSVKPTFTTITTSELGLMPDGSIFSNTVYISTAQTFEFIAGSKYFAVIELESDTVGDLQNRLILRYSDNTFESFGTTTIGMKKVAQILSPSKTLKANLKVREGNLGLVKFKSAILINLTSIGLDALNVDQCNQRFHTWFDGTKSTLANGGRLRSVGKNLFTTDTVIENNPSLELKVLGINSLRTYTDRNSKVGGKLVFKLKPNAPYTFKENIIYGGSANKVYQLITDTNAKTLATINGSGSPQIATFTTPGDGVVKIEFARTGGVSDLNSWVDLYDIQLEEGLTATPYELHKESSAYIPAKEGGYRSLPNGVKDEFNAVTGEQIKKIGSKVLQASDIYSINTSNINYDTASTIALSDILYDAVKTDNAFIPNWKQTSVSYITDNISFVWNYYISSGKRIVFIVPKGTYTNLTDAQSKLSGINLTYQLESFATTQLAQPQNLISFPNGTVCSEPIIPDAGIYSSKMTILNPNALIKRLDKLSRVDYTTGIETKLDVSKAVIASDKKSFTHPDLANGNIAFFEYEYEAETTVPELELTHYDSRYVLKDSVTGKFYKVVPTVANGVLTNGLVEV